MVGAGTGGVMTAIMMIFEMTRDYGIIVPVIVAVAVAAGVRRALVSETIYTIKLRHRGHRIPKERHINLYLVQQAQDVMERSSWCRQGAERRCRRHRHRNRRRPAADRRRARGRGWSAWCRRAPACGWRRNGTRTRLIDDSSSRAWWCAATSIC